jgi:hypothetical protein
MTQDDMNLYNDCFIKALMLIEKGYPIGNMSADLLTDLLVKLETEKREKNLQSDKNIIFNDEIVSIEEVGDKETIDISVTGDNLFYCNGILTKNSFGLPATADFMFAIINTDELIAMNQIMVKQLKNRYNDPDLSKRFIVGINRSKMKLFDVEQTAQDDIVDDKPLMDKTTFGKREKDKFKTSKFKKTFEDFK